MSAEAVEEERAVAVATADHSVVRVYEHVAVRETNIEV
jgi:hypothetical protein